MFPRHTRPAVAARSFRLELLEKDFNITGASWASLHELQTLQSLDFLTSPTQALARTLGPTTPVSPFRSVADRVCAGDTVGSLHPDAFNRNVWVRMVFEHSLFRRPRFRSDGDSFKKLFEIVLSDEFSDSCGSLCFGLRKVWSPALRRSWFPTGATWTVRSLLTFLSSAPSPSTVRAVFSKFPPPPSQEVLTACKRLTSPRIPAASLAPIVVFLDGWFPQLLPEVLSNVLCFDADELLSLFPSVSHSARFEIANAAMSGRFGLLFNPAWVGLLGKFFPSQPEVGDVLAARALSTWVASSPDVVVARWLKYASPVALAAVFSRLSPAGKRAFAAQVVEFAQNAGIILQLPPHSAPELFNLIRSLVSPPAVDSATERVFWALAADFPGSIAQALQTAKASTV